MAIERLRNGFFQISACYRPLGEKFQQNLTFVQEPGGAIAALECKMVDESLLQGSGQSFAVMAEVFRYS
jgi:hypothetical protein